MFSRTGNICSIAAVLTLLPVCQAIGKGASCTAAASATPLPAAQFEDGPTIAQEALLADFDAWLSNMHLFNPDLAVRADLHELDQVATRIRDELTGPMSRRQAWMHFAKLNPYLHDGHGGIQMPNYRAALEAHIKAGGRVVPFEVRFAHDGSLQVSRVSVDSRIKIGDTLLSLNGHETVDMISRMLALSIGDTSTGQRAWLEHRFAMLYWYLYGDTGDYDLIVQGSGKPCPVAVRLPGAATLPEVLKDREDPAGVFAWRILPGQVGYLRVDTFDPGLKGALDKITQEAFSNFKQHAVRSLIIDVRENDGGDDPLWEQDLVDHITGKPYRQLSHYEQRVTSDNADPGDVIGSVRRADYSQNFTPPAADPDRFTGPVYILDGPYSYSAAIQFIVAAQDFGIARIAGEETAAFACQTGQVKRIDLPWTRLSAATPLIAYTRPSGRGCKRGVIADIPIKINEVNPDETLNALVAHILRHQ